MSARHHKLTRELVTAEEALRAGDVRHAAHHAECALALEPDHPQAQALVDRILGEPPRLWQRAQRLLGRWRPIDWFPESDWYGHAAIRARVDWRAGRLDEAFRLMVSVALTAPDVGYSSWLLGIAGDARARGHLLDPQPYFLAFGSDASKRYIGLLRLTPTERLFNSLWADLGVLLLEIHRGQTTPAAETLAMCAASFLRRAGRNDESLAVARGGLSRCRDEHRPLLLTQAGLAARATGAFDEAVSAFLEAHELTSESDYLAEAARVRFDERRFAEALQLFERTGMEGADLEVRMVMDACRLRLGLPVSDGSLTAELFPARAPDYDEVRRFMLGDGCRIRMSDATVNALRQVVGQDPSLRPPVDLKLGVSCLESPSVLLTLALVTGTELDAVPYSYDAIQKPDAFSPLAPEGIDPWQRSGTLCTRKLPPPPPEVCDMVTGMVRLPWPAGTELWRRARELPHDHVDLRDLTAAMVNPPPWPQPSAPAMPDGTLPDEHVFRRQVACAFLMATTRRQQPWAASVRREGLRALVLGPPDWTTAAGLLALTHAVLEEPEALEDVREWLDILVASRPDMGHCCWALPLQHLHVRVPGLRRNLLDPLKGWLEPEEDDEAAA